MASYNQVIKDKNHWLARQLELENGNILGKSFQSNANHPLVYYKVKTKMTVATKKRDFIQEEEEEGKRDFTP